MWFDYDLGDGWTHRVVCERIVPLAEVTDDNDADDDAAADDDDV